MGSHVIRGLGKPRTQHMRRVASIPKQKLPVRCVLGLALLIVIGVASYHTIRTLDEAEQEEVRVETALVKFEAIASQMKDVEIGQHRYLITGDERYLESYRTAVQTVDQTLRELRALTVNQPGYQQKIDVLAPLILAKFAEVAQTSDMRKHQGRDAALQLVLARQNKPILDDILQSIGELRDEEDHVLQQEAQEAEAPPALLLGITLGSFCAILLAVLLIIRDVVERKRADEALSESTARFHRLAKNALDMIYRYRLLPTPGFEYVSPAATTISGYTPQDFYADPELSYKLVHPEDHGLIESLKSPSDSTMPLTVRWMHKDGTVVWTSQQLVPVYDPEGRLMAIEGIVRDITERVHAYQMLERRVEERTHEIERRRQVAEGLRDTLTVLNSIRPLDEILDAIVIQACRLLATDGGAVYSLEDQEQLLSIQAARGLDADDAAVNIPVGWGAMGQVVLTRQPVVSNLAAAAHGAAGPAGGPGVQADLYRRYQTLLAVPLLIKDAVYGVLALYYREPRELSGEEIEIAVAFSDQAALAIENARLRVQAEQMAVAAERSRLARDLHDAVTQTLFSTSLIADVLPRLWERNIAEARVRLNELRQLTRGALAEMRTLLLELRPATLTEVGLGELLRQLAEATISRARVQVDLIVEGQCHLPPDVQIALYRIAQETLNNVARHACASRATLYLCCQSGRVELRISDDGQGFDPASVGLEHLGLAIMRERAETIDARLQIDSHPGRGTQILAIWPDKRAMPGGSASGDKRPDPQCLAVSGGRYG